MHYWVPVSQKIKEKFGPLYKAESTYITSIKSTWKYRETEQSTNTFMFITDTSQIFFGM